MARAIPNYSLYGDQALPDWQSFFDFEWIPERSRPYNWEIQPHTHDSFIQILCLTRGSVQALLDQGRFCLEAPCILLVPAQTVHGFQFSNDVDGPVVTAAQRPLESLAGVVMPDLQKIFHATLAAPLPRSEGEVDELMQLFFAIERESRVQAFGHVAAGMSLLIALLVKIARLQQRQLDAPLQPASRRMEQIQRFRVLIERHFKEDLSMQAYASELGVTLGQLTRLCREALGMSSLEVVQARRIHEAKRDLVYTTNSVRQVAHRLGFADEAYFSRFFRKQTGMAPREFRTLAAQAMRDPA